MEVLSFEIDEVLTWVGSLTNIAKKGNLHKTILYRRPYCMLVAILNLVENVYKMHKYVKSCILGHPYDSMRLENNIVMSMNWIS